MSEIPTKPYLIRAIYDWCTDNGYTPYLSVQVDANTRVPMAYVKDGSIILNISMEAVQHLQLGNEDITCNGRFGGVAHKLEIPITSVTGIFAKESGQGLAFQGQDAPPVTASQNSASKITDASKKPDDDEPPKDPPPSGKPHLRIVK